MAFKQINVDAETFEKINEISNLFQIKKYVAVKKIVEFFSENISIVDEKFFASEQKNLDAIDDKLEKMFKSILQSEVNRIISFIKVQDKFMANMKRDLVKLVDSDHSKTDSPLFYYYDIVFEYCELFLEKNNLSFNDVYEEIKKNQGIDYAQEFQKALNNIQTKSVQH
ncbi:hypothetical protein BPO_p0006 (plasmid) [Bergeyella porcorum]|uniref:Uncharacterized protein n=1 Tax=Bergeyella porcorum TaxID=1735111 RepID=A0AAU0F4C0_9FLAO